MFIGRQYSVVDHWRKFLLVNSLSTGLVGDIFYPTDNFPHLDAGRASLVDKPVKMEKSRSIQD